MARDTASTSSASEVSGFLHGDDVDTLNCNSAITSRQPVASIQAP